MKRSIGARTVLYAHPVLIVGTYDRSMRPNAMAVSWGGVCCSLPPCVAISVQRTRYTYTNLMEQEAFTISIPPAVYIKQADYFGIASGREVDKFAATGLTPIKSELVNAPYIEEFPVVLECKVIHVHDIGLHTQFLGEILDVKIDDAVLGEDGRPDISKIKPLVFDSPTSSYYGIGQFLAQAFVAGKELMR